MFVSRSKRRLTGAALVAIAAFALTGCANPGTAPGASSGGPSASPANTAQIPARTEGAFCKYNQYGGKGVKKIDLKNATIGFAQSEKEANPFRIAETQSMKDEAARLGYKLLVTNAQGDLNKEISDIQSMISQGAKALVISPLLSEGLDPALKSASDAGVPIMTIDRLLTTKKACQDFIGNISSDFVDQGKKAADALITATGDKGNVAILLGATGVSATVDRTKGFKDELVAKNSQLKIVAEQTADFAREKGQTVFEQMLSKNPDITALYAENDEMALGAVAAIKAAGKQPGDIKVLTIDGTRGAVQGIIDGYISGVIESNPRFGPLAFAALDAFYNGKGVAERTIIRDNEYTKDNAASTVQNAY